MTLVATTTIESAGSPDAPALSAGAEAQAHKAIVTRFVDELWNRAHLDVADELFAPGCVPHTFTYDPDSAGSTVPDARRGPTHIKAIVAGWRRAFPDWHINVEDMFAEGDRVMLLTTGVGTHLGPLMGLAPTGRRVTFTGMRVFRFVGNRIVEYWVLWDWRGLWMQLGQAPTRDWLPGGRRVREGGPGGLGRVVGMALVVAAAAAARVGLAARHRLVSQRLIAASALARSSSSRAAATS